MYGVILKFTPSPDNTIDYEDVQQRQVEYKLKNKVENNTPVRNKRKEADEFQLLKRPAHSKTPINSNNKRRHNKSPIPNFLKDNPTDNQDTSYISMGDESMNVSSYNPEFLKEGYIRDESSGEEPGYSDSFADRCRQNRGQRMEINLHGTRAPSHTQYIPSTGGLKTSRPKISTFLEEESKFQPMVPLEHDNPFDKTYNNIHEGFLTDDKGRKLERASDASESESGNRYNNYYTEPKAKRAVSPMNVRTKTRSIDLNNIVGLENRSQDCFMNASLQCIFTIPEFMEYFVHKKYLDHLISMEKYRKMERDSTTAMKLSGYRFSDTMYYL